MDLPLFHNVVFKSVPGASPDLLLLDKEGSIIQRIDLSPLDQKALNDLLLQKGFFKREHADTQIPEKYLTGPYEEIIDDEEQHEETEEPGDHEDRQEL